MESIIIGNHSSNKVLVKNEVAILGSVAMQTCIGIIHVAGAVALIQSRLGYLTAAHALYRSYVSGIRF